MSSVVSLWLFHCQENNNKRKRKKNTGDVHTRRTGALFWIQQIIIGIILFCPSLFDIFFYIFFPASTCTWFWLEPARTIFWRFLFVFFCHRISIFFFFNLNQGTICWTFPRALWAKLQELCFGWEHVGHHEFQRWVFYCALELYKDNVINEKREHYHPIIYISSYYVMCFKWHCTSYYCVCVIYVILCFSVLNEWSSRRHRGSVRRKELNIPKGQSWKFMQGEACFLFSF